ncbi:myo-inosose-2 dehydratase [Enterococcus sp. HY326]|uniref:myo-inosose-2 dehydratase n=1 Tax=Enterococcus sp. HY326 TaxID=2971265 RepID=UPI00223FD09E|nr:myo-inosose-2 dehydratase [Enterococcus sp. HY326]
MFDGKNIQLGISPLGWSNDDMPELGAENSYEQCINETSLAGFSGTEVGIKFPSDPKSINESLKSRNLKVASKWFSSFLCSTPYEENEAEFLKELDFLESVGSNRINVCELTRNLFASEKSMFGNAKPVASDEEWVKLTTGLNKLGKVANERGFKLCFHHHMATVVQTYAETKRLLENTDPELVYLCFDTGHFTFSNEDAVQACQDFVNRIGHVHLKDIRKDKMTEAISQGYKFRKAVVEGCFTVPGDGFVNFPRIFEILDSNDYEGWLLVEAEQNPKKANPLEYAVKARKYLQEKTGL